MADFNLLDIQPHIVSRDMRGYCVFFYGDGKTGKTTTATKFPNHLLLALEKGYNAIPGAMAQPINSWSEFKKALRQLKGEEVKARFETIIVDTADIAYDYCEKYICSNNGVDTIGDIPFGKGFKLAAKEFDDALRSILQMGYGLVIISHAQDKTFKDQNGQEYNQIVPTLDNKPRNIVNRMADIIGYARTVEDVDGSKTTKLFMRGTPRFVAGSRFKYTPDHIDFNYHALVNAIGDAIDRQAEEDGVQYFTETGANLHTIVAKELDYDSLMVQFNNILNTLVNNSEDDTFTTYWQPRVTQVIETYLGKNAKVSQCTRDQVEALDLIVSDLKEFIK